MVSADKWSQLSLAQQLGNIGSEIARARRWEEKADRVQQINALERALELIDLTLADPRWKERLKELARFREVVCDRYLGTKVYDLPEQFLERYCIQLSLAGH